MDMERSASSPWDGQKITSPATQLIKSVGHPFSLWSAELKKTGLAFEESDAVAFWNVLSAIYALTEEEHVKLRATDAYAFAGGSATTGKRKLVALIQAKLVLTTRNTAKRNEKFVSVSDEARRAVLQTLDRWTDCYEAEFSAYRKYRSSDAGQRHGA